MARITDLATKVRGWFKRTAGAGLLAVSLQSTPSSLHRPRVGRYGTYYPKGYTKAKDEATKLVADIEATKIEGPVACLVEVVVEKPRTGKLEYPRGDTDNFAKLPLDVLTKAQKFWNDDNDVVFLAVTKRYAQPGESQGYNVMYFPVN